MDLRQGHRTEAMASKKCPVCGVSVKVENLERHVRNQHPRAQVDREELLTSEERRSVEDAKSAERPRMTRRGKQLVAVAAIVVVVLFVLLAFNPFRPIGVQVGQQAPNFTLSADNGGSLTLSSLRGKPVLLEFMDVDCHYCQQEAPVLVTVYQNYSGQVNFLSVDANIIGTVDTMSRIDTFKTSYGTTWTYVLADPATVQTYGITGTPTTFILDKNGVVVQVIAQEVGYATFAAALNQALQG